MKKTPLLLLFCLVVVLLSFSKIEFQPKATTADVHKLNGMAVFIESEPVLEYETLGDVKYDGTFGVSGQYQEVRDALIRKAKKKHKDADGIIIRFCNGCTDRADVIKFK
jgi:hypothetical protein